jgi:hypothetical protein
MHNETAQVRMAQLHVSCMHVCMYVCMYVFMWNDLVEYNNNTLCDTYMHMNAFVTSRHVRETVIYALVVYIFMCASMYMVW